MLDGRVLVRSSQIEMGQGINTGLTTLIAEELDVAPEAVQVTLASGGVTKAGPVYANMILGNVAQMTGGSTSTQAFWARYRAVAAVARERFLAAGPPRVPASRRPPPGGKPSVNAPRAPDPR